MRRQAVLGLNVLLAGGLSALGYEISDIVIESWVGTGDQRVVLVVDFWPYNGDGDSFAFGYRFTGASISGLAVLNALHEADNGLTFAESGGFVTDFWYLKDGVTYHTGYVWPESYWSYWLSADLGQTWEYAPVGPEFRALSDGQTDGWLALPGDDYESEPVVPLVPPGDLNCDGEVTFADINPFTLALLDPPAYESAFPDCDRLHGDLSGEGALGFEDINLFVGLLTQ